jgi:uracil phosphoribosyltransferase
MYFEVDHPCVKHKLTILRDKKTCSKEFRELASELTKFIAYEALKNLELEDVQIETPLTKMTGQCIKNDVIFVPVLRAGVGMLDGVLDLVPTGKVGFVGLYRDHDTKKAVEYYCKLPTVDKNSQVLVIDPMLATGGSLIATIAMLKREGYERVTVITIISSPEGIKALEDAYPDVKIYTGNVDEYLDENKYIIPGLGDAGDRLFGTK